jgi:tellurite resistance protein
MSDSIEEQYKKFSTPSKKTVPILSLKNFDIYENGTIRITNHDQPSSKSAPTAKVTETKQTEKKKFEGKVDLSKVAKKDTKWFVIRKKKFGPYSKKQLVELYRAKKISKNEKLEGNNTQEMTLMKILFAPKDKVKKPDTAAMRVLKLNILMAISDGDLDESELKQLYEYCEEHSLSKNILNETLQFLNQDGPPPVDLIDETLTKDDFLKCVEMAKADGEVSSSEITLLRKMLRKLRKSHPELADQKLKDFLG